MVEPPGVGAALLDLFRKVAKQADVVQRRGRSGDMNASHTSEPARDIDDVDGATTGTFDLAAMCH
jgi:hypothetical protein